MSQKQGHWAQRIVQVPHSLGWAGRLLALTQEPLDGLHIGAVSTKIENIPGRPGEDGGLVPQDAAQAGHVGLQCIRRGRRRGVPPDGGEQMIGAYDLAGMQRQAGQQRPAPQATHPPWLTADHDVERAKKTHLHDAPGHRTIENPEPSTDADGLQFDGPAWRVKGTLP